MQGLSYLRATKGFAKLTKIVENGGDKLLRQIYEDRKNILLRDFRFQW